MYDVTVELQGVSAHQKTYFFELQPAVGRRPAVTCAGESRDGAKLLGWEGQIGALKAGYLADVIAVPGNPLEDISVLQRVTFVMKGGAVQRR